MRPSLVLAASIATSVACASCGGNQKHASDEDQFACRDRSASYLATKTMAGDEIGVQIDCAQAGPRITRWHTDKTGKRDEDTHVLSPGQFDKIWSEIDGTGWPNMHDCENGDGGKRDPVYVFNIQDDTNKASFSCQTRVMPYPYNDITDPLDLAAQQGH
jgi:hypothetical protein